MIPKPDTEAAKLLLHLVTSQIADIKRLRTDWEQAALIEHQMHISVLRALANSSPSSAAALIIVARKALESLDIKFPRI